MREIFIFAYGSLMKQSEISRALGRGLASSDLYAAKLKSHVRTWGAIRDNNCALSRRVVSPRTGVAPPLVGYLNVEQSGSDDFVCGVCFKVKISELHLFDHREAGYDRIDVSDLIESNAAVNENHKPKVYCYSCVSSACGSCEHPSVNYHYLNLVYKTCVELQKDMPEILDNYINHTLMPKGILGEYVVFYFNHDYTSLIEFSTHNGVKSHFLTFDVPIFSSIQRPMLNRGFAERYGQGYLGWYERFQTALLSQLSSGGNAKELSSDESFLVRLALSLNNSTSEDVCQKLKQDEDVWVAKLAALAYKRFL